MLEIKYLELSRAGMYNVDDLSPFYAMEVTVVERDIN
jgi:hypothetical protein